MKDKPPVLQTQGLAGLLLMLVCLAFGSFGISCLRKWPPQSEHWSVSGFYHYVLWETGLSAEPPNDYVHDLIVRCVEPLHFGELVDDEFDEFGAAVSTQRPSQNTSEE